MSYLVQDPNNRMDEQGSHQEVQVEKHVKDGEGKCRSC